MPNFGFLSRLQFEFFSKRRDAVLRLSVTPTTIGFRLLACVAPALVIAGCSGAQAAKENVASWENVISNPQIEAPVNEQGLPSGWSIKAASGTYKSAASKTSHSGNKSLAFAGSGGQAEIRTNQQPIHKGDLLEADLWVQSSMLDKAELSARLVISNSVDGAEIKSVAVPVKGDTQDWQRFQFLCEAPDATSDMNACLAVSLRGEGLLRIDDVSLKNIPNVANDMRLADGGFEKPNEKGAFPGWKSHFDAKDCTTIETRETPHTGNSSVRIKGAGGWGCLASEKPIPGKPVFVCFRGYVRAHKGEGHLQIDYAKNGVTFAKTCSPEITSDQWTFVSIFADPAWVARANGIVTTMAAKDPGGEFSADFDDLELFVCY